jgi:ATP phosphoribosyltransferase regulatory subunit
MSAESAREFEALEAQASTLLDLFRRAGYEQVAPSIIQPADIFLDQIGEALRGRTYVFTDLAGEELCLRPDLTVPVSRLYLERHPKADKPARYCYNGPAFRFQPRGPRAAREFRQAGIECFGVHDREAADQEIVQLAVEGVRRAGLKDFRLRLGDIGLFYALIDALSLPERWRLKLRHYFWRPASFHALLARLARGEGADGGDGPLSDLAAKLPTEDPAKAEELVANYLETKGLPQSGNRTLAEIAERLIDHAKDLRAEPLRKEVATIIDHYLAVDSAPQEAIDRIAMIGKGAGLDLGPQLCLLARRFERLQETVDLSTARFATEFGRDLEYYSGMVFQIETGPSDAAIPIAGGGRYDRLLSSLGAKTEGPAVGAAIHTERLLAASSGVR